MNRVRERLSSLSAKVWGDTPKVNTGRPEGSANATEENPSEREQLDTLPFSGASIKVSDSRSSAPDGPDNRGPCTRDYETDERRTHRHVRDDSRWDIYQSHHASGQSHD